MLVSNQDYLNETDSFVHTLCALLTVFFNKVKIKVTDDGKLHDSHSCPGAEARLPCTGATRPSDHNQQICVLPKDKATEAERSRV